MDLHCCRDFGFTIRTGCSRAHYYYFTKYYFAEMGKNIMFILHHVVARYLHDDVLKDIRYIIYESTWVAKYCLLKLGCVHFAQKIPFFQFFFRFWFLFELNLDTHKWFRLTAALLVYSIPPFVCRGIFLMHCNPRIMMFCKRSVI